MIELCGVVKRFGSHTAVDGVSLRLAPGSLTAVIGPSGSGKSTLLRLINRLLPCDSGHILLNGQDINKGPPEALRRSMGYVIQSIGLFPHWTVARNIATVPSLLGWPAAQINARVDELLALLDLDAATYRGRYPHQLSGGQQQRVGVARALAARPAVLLMDEPFGALDPVTRQSLQHTLRAVQHSQRCTTVLVTHDLDEALGLADQLVLLDQGRVLQAGTPLQLLAQPASAAVRQFLGPAQQGQRLLGQRHVASLMRPGAAPGGDALRPDQTLLDALAAFLAQGAEALPVVDSAGQVLGALHFTDLLRGARPGA